MRALFAWILLLFVSSYAFSQSPNCPKLSIMVPAVMAAAGSKVELRIAGTDDLASRNAQVTWKISRGSIISGQGSPKITVVFPDDASSRNAEISASVLLQNGCRTFLTDEIGIQASPIVDYYHSEFGKVTNSDLRAWIDNAYILAFHQPTTEVVFDMHFPPNTTNAYKKSRIERILRNITFRRYDPNRFSFYLGDALPEEKTITWLADPTFDLAKQDIDRQKLIRAEDFARRRRELLP